MHNHVTAFDEISEICTLIYSEALKDQNILIIYITEHSVDPDNSNPR